MKNVQEKFDTVITKNTSKKSLIPLLQKIHSIFTIGNSRKHMKDMLIQSKKRYLF